MQPASNYNLKGLPDWKRQLFELTDFFIENRACTALRRGFIFSLPFVLLEALMQFLLLIIGYFPELPLQFEISEMLLISVQTLNITFAPILAFCIGYNIGKEWLLKNSQCFVVGFIALIAFKIFIGNHLSFSTFHVVTSALLGAFCTGVIMVYVGIPITRCCEHRLSFISSICLHNVLATLPAMVISIGILVGLEVGFETMSGGLSLQEWANEELFSNLSNIDGDDLGAATAVSLLVHFTSLFAINGSTLFEGTSDAIYGQMLMENVNAAASGVTPTHIINSVFNDNAMMMGGSGAMIALVFAIFIARCRNTTTFIAKLSLPMNLINVNEILLFGLPVVLNPIFLIPFLLIPEINLILAYFATLCDYVPLTIHNVNRTIPPVVSGYLATESMHGAVLQIVLIAIDTVLYLPFVYLFKQYASAHAKVVVRQVVTDLQECEAHGKSPDFHRYDGEKQRIVNTLVNELRIAVNKNSPRLFMVFQPQFTKEGVCIGAESLLRWDHPEYGFIYPPLIIAIAKYGGFLFKLESTVIMKTSTLIARVENELRMDKFKIAANISGDMASNEKMEDAVNNAVRSTGINPDHLWLELTEQDTVDLTVVTLDRLDRLRARGHHLCIDDFGMGHTSIRYIKTRKFEVVKIDGSLTRDILDDVESQQIVSSLNKLAKTLNMKVFAEFVETKMQLERLHELGCDVYQGYYFSKPLEENEFLKILAEAGNKAKVSAVLAND